MPQNQTKRELLEKVDKSRDMIIELARSIIRIPSENIPPGGDELNCQKFVFDFFKKMSHVDADFVYPENVQGIKEHEAYLPGRNYKNRPNVIARYRGRGRGKSLLLTGHIDTVPLGDNSWKHHPYAADIEDGKLYGRGSYDMKAGLSCMMAAVKIIKELGITLKGDLLFESVVDEENAGCNGTLANRLIGHNADAAILAEPSNLDIYTAHKGFRIVHLIVEGDPGISFAGEKLENPVEHIGKLIECIKLFREKRRKDTAIPHIYQKDDDPVPVLLTKLQAGEFSYRIPMAIPNTCKLEVYWLTMPGESREFIEKELFDFLDDWCKRDPYFKSNPPGWNFSHRWMPGTKIDESHPIIKTVKAIGKDITHKSLRIKGAPFPCDLFILNLYGDTPGIILGPRGGNAHSADEFAIIEDLIKLTGIYACTAAEWCGIA
jgi:acetylornithine deacetylase